MLNRLLKTENRELPALGWSFGYFFLLLASYYLLRPVRDSLAIETGTEALRWLFAATFLAMLAMVPLFGWLCSRFPRKTLLPLVYGFFAINILMFSFYLNTWIFFIWLSVFNLFAVSVFWSFMADLFDTPQAARLYGSIAAGGSCGAIAGPLIAALLSTKIQTEGLLLLAAGMLFLMILCIRKLSRWAEAHPRAGEPPPEEPIGGSIVAGARAALSSPFLLAVCGYLFCYTALSTALYFQQVEILREALPDRAERMRFLSSVDLVVNGLTLIVQLAAFSRLAAILGPIGMLAAMPVVSVAGFLWLGASPTLAALVVFGVTRRAGEFAISKPARETLFTAVPREERYKAKNFIDTAVYRGGDALSGWIFAGPAAFLAAGLAAVWTGLAVYLGTRMKSWTGKDVLSLRRL
jgi:AAA family ATP:ADP antiporter